MSYKQHHIIYIHGLGDYLLRNAIQKIVLQPWRLFGVRPHYHIIRWADQRSTFKEKLSVLLEHIDKLHKQGHTISLVGASAGASMALVALAKRPNEIHRVVCIAAKLRDIHTLHMTASYVINPAYKDALELFQKIESKFSTNMRRRVLLIKPQTDRLVPVRDMYLQGAQIHQLSTNGHLVTIFLALTRYRRIILDFIKTN